MLFRSIRELIHTEKIFGSQEGAALVKSILDPYMDLIHEMKVFSVSEEFDRDDGFYSQFDECYERLFQIVPLYNKARSYCTRKAFNKGKMKLNIGNPTLANGWDLNKE